MTRKGFTCLDPRAWQSDAAVKATVERFLGYALIVTTFPVPAAFVRLLREETGAKVVGYFDPMHIPLPGASIEAERAVLRLALEGRNLYVRRASDNTHIQQYPGTALYIHDDMTATIVGSWLAERQAAYALDGFFLDNLPPRLSDWHKAYLADQAKPSRVLRWGNKTGTVNTLAMDYEHAAWEVVASARECVGDEAVLIANSGMPWRNEYLDGLCFEDNWFVGSWLTSQPPYTGRERYDCALIRNDAERAAREAIKLPSGALQLYQGDA